MLTSKTVSVWLAIYDTDEQNAAMRILECKSLRSGASRQQTDKLLINLMNGTLNNYKDI